MRVEEVKVVGWIGRDVVTLVSGWGNSVCGSAINCTENTLRKRSRFETWGVEKI